LYKRIRSKVLVRKVRAHVSSVSEVREHSIPAFLVFGNELADTEAKAGVNYHGTDCNYQSRLSFYDAMATIVLKRAVAIFSLFQLPNSVFEKEGPTEGPETHLIAPVKIPLSHSSQLAAVHAAGHLVRACGRSANVYTCSYCFARGGLAAFCRASLKMQCASFQFSSLAHGVQPLDASTIQHISPTHLVRQQQGIVLCIRCGAASATRFQKLALPCTVPTAAGNAVLKRVANSQIPYPHMRPSTVLVPSWGSTCTTEELLVVQSVVRSVNLIARIQPGVPCASPTPPLLPPPPGLADAGRGSSWGWWVWGSCWWGGRRPPCPPPFGFC
jgi:hypothetical protein